MAFLHNLPIADLIAHYGYIAIFVIITLESAGLPLPGETVLLTSAAYAGSTGNLNVGLVVAIAAFAAILGDNAGYWVGRRWGLPLLLSKGHLIGLDHGRLKLGQHLFRQHGGKIVFFGRFTAMLRAYAAVLAGVNKLDARRFIAFNALGGVVWASIMGFGAYWFGRSIENVMGPVGFGLLGFVLLGAVALWLFMRRHEARLMVAAEAAIPGPLVEGSGQQSTLQKAAPAVDDLVGDHPERPDFQTDATRLHVSSKATENRRHGATPWWFKAPVILFLSTFGMSLTSWYLGVTGGFYGRLVGEVGSIGVLLILCAAAVILELIRRNLKTPPQPSSAIHASADETMNFAA